MVIIRDTTRPTIAAETPIVSGNVITWSGTATEDVAIRKVRMIIRDLVRNEYWNGTTWISSADAATDPRVLLTADLSAPLATNLTWSYRLDTDRTGTFQTLHWAQNGAYSYNADSPPVQQIIVKLS